MFDSAGFNAPIVHRLLDVRLERLEEVHNDADFAAWTGSMKHIKATPGFAKGDWGADDWPVTMTLEQNMADLADHHRAFDERIGFAYSVLRHEDVIGSVYIETDETHQAEVKVRSWVVAVDAELDRPLAVAVKRWILEKWPVLSVRYVGRPDL
jgi:hypothetical protein